jgi:hypothetical protein
MFDFCTFVMFVCLWLKFAMLGSTETKQKTAVFTIYKITTTPPTVVCHQSVC